MSKQESFRIENPLKIQVELTHLTNGTSLRASTMIDAKGKVHGPNPKWNVDLVETEKTGLTLEVPQDFCVQGEGVRLNLIASSETEETPLEITAKVIKQSFEAGSGKKRDTVTLGFVNYDKDIWEKIQSRFGKLQQEVERTFRIMKGNPK